jgi:chaperonin cofactor prefoldin
MDDKKLLKNIGDLIDTKLDQKLRPINEKLDTLEVKIEVLNKKIDKSQEETIETLSELITTGYNSHEKRIKRVGEHLHLPQIQ